MAKVDAAAKFSDVVVLLNGDNALAESAKLKSMRASSDFEVLPNVYASSSSSSVAKDMDSAAARVLEQAVPISARDMCALVGTKEWTGVYKVSGTLSVECLRSVHAASATTKVVMAHVTDSVAVVPTATAAAAAMSESGRKLADSGETNSGFEIYYDSTYLLITPDIFTGIMTGIFLFCVVLLGMTCLSSIQGPYSFADRNPVVGKEC